MPSIKSLTAGKPPTIEIVCTNCGDTWKPDMGFPNLQAKSVDTEFRPPTAFSVLDPSFNHLKTSFEDKCPKCRYTNRLEIAVDKEGACIVTNPFLPIDKNWNKQESTVIVR